MHSSSLNVVGEIAKINEGTVWRIVAKVRLKKKKPSGKKG